MNDEELTPLQQWEQRYAGSDAVWSGRVNDSLAVALEGLPPGRALDLGCGEGADVVWLAERGWDALGIDLSPTAIERARRAAGECGLDRGAEGAGRAHFEQGDLDRWIPRADAYDLVTASFLHARDAQARIAVLRRAADGIAVGGRLVVLSHAAPPPWATALHEHRAEMLSAHEEHTRLALDPAQWELVTAPQIQREAVSPDGAPAHLEDSLLVLRRRC
ncbi:class I SAM-dependent methyltransferase [Brachybacterium muris]|uniref:class I SAM-dependent methyltransferase n=1 Tax=Brachybacterium muris TaxID=219301 RepID=UPI00223B125B|nr:class I SAM-dependent methyltransferase [Brachybacterium muris]MCT2178661.1 class I SAM-dependent methyltransferase [Brachybacterium muris]